MIKSLILSALFLSLSTVARAQETSGYVVKADSATVYLDRTSTAAAVGQEFTIYEEGEELKHPVTGVSLGRIQKDLAHGRIQDILPQYYVGKIDLSGNPDLSALKPGLHYKFAAGTPLPQAPQASEPAAAQTQQPHGVQWRSPAVSMEAVDIAAGDLLGDGKTEIILADEHRVQAFPDDGGDWKPLCVYDDTNTGIKIVSIDAADLNKDGRAEVFVTSFNSFFNRVETVVLECRDGKFERQATLPWATRAFQDASGEWKLAAQQLMEDHSFPLANIYTLEFQDGKYVQSGNPLNHKRFDWEYGFAMAKDASIGDPFEIFYTAATDSIRLQFAKGSWVSPESYGQTASRVRWFDNELMFRPRMIVTQTNGGITGLYTVRNNAALGGLAGPFGLYSSGEVDRLKWTGLGLETEWKTDISGYAADIVLAKPDAGHPEELLVAVVGKGGKSSVWKLKP